MTRERPNDVVVVRGQSQVIGAVAEPAAMAFHPEARCLCGTPAVDHVPRLRYVLRAWLTHRWVFGVGALRGRL